MEKKTIALVAHDARKAALVAWVEQHLETLAPHDMVCTGTTGLRIKELLQARLTQTALDRIDLKRLKSGPLGGDQQLGALIAEGKVDFFIFFWDTMTAQPHDVDVKALLRLATLYNVPTACNQATADYLISSPRFKESYNREQIDFSEYLNRTT